MHSAPHAPPPMPRLTGRAPATLRRFALRLSLAPLGLPDPGPDPLPEDEDTMPDLEPAGSPESYRQRQEDRAWEEREVPLFVGYVEVGA